MGLGVMVLVRSLRIGGKVAINGKRTTPWTVESRAGIPVPCVFQVHNVAQIHSDAQADDI